MMETSFIIIILIILFYSSVGTSNTSQDYKESLLLKLLPADGKVLAHFDHVITWNHMSPLDMTSFSNGER